jgi:signal transduction histidine kinase
VTLRRPLLLLILAAMLPLVVLSAALGAFFLREQSVKIEEQALFQVRQLATVISSDLTAQLDLLLIVAQGRVFDGTLDVDASRVTLERIQRQHSSWAALRVTTPEQQVLIDVPGAVAEGQPVDVASHRQAVEQRQPVVGHMLHEPERPAVFQIRAPVIRDGEIKYVISAMVTPEAIAKLLANVHLDPAWIGTVIDGDGYVVARTTGPALVGEQASARALAARRSGDEGFYEGFTLERTPTMSVFRRVGVAGWSVHIGVPSVIFSAPKDQAVLLVTLAGVATLILVGVFLWLLQRELSLQRQAEQTLQQARTELSHVTRVATLGELTASITHEVNQPLGAVVANAEASLRWLAGATPNIAEARSSIEGIIRDAHRATAVVKRTRELSKKADPEKTRLDINNVINSAILLVQREAVSNRVSLETELAGGLPAVRGDRAQLQQVIINFLVNGIEAMASNTDAPRKLLVRSHLGENNHVIVAVQDLGCGIAPENASRVFEPFFTTKPDGMGMGLSICRSIIEAHGGRVWVFRNSGVGTTFQFALGAEQGIAS